MTHLYIEHQKDIANFYRLTQAEKTQINFVICVGYGITFVPSMFAKELKNLREIELFQTSVENLNGIWLINNLQALIIIKCNKLTNIDGIILIQKLEKLKISEIDFSQLQLDNIKMIHQQKLLQCMEISYCDDIQHGFPFFNCFRILRLRIIVGIDKPQDVTQLLNNCSNLTDLAVEESNKLENINFIRGMRHLQRIDLKNLTNLKNIYPVRHCQQLQHITIKNTYVTDISPLTQLPVLISLLIDEIIINNAKCAINIQNDQCQIEQLMKQHKTFLVYKKYQQTPDILRLNVNQLYQKAQMFRSSLDRFVNRQNRLLVQIMNRLLYYQQQYSDINID